MPIKIIISDDHAVFRSGLKALLANEKDCQVISECGNGFDTVQAVRQHDVDLLLLDLNLPGLSGSKVAELVKAEKPQVAILILTMHEDEYYMQELLNIGVNGYLLKKSTANELMQAIHAVHAGKQYIDSTLINCIVDSYVGRNHHANVEEARSGMALLTPRECEVTKLLAFGHTNSEIAERLNISVRTVETHRNNIMSKLKLKSRADIVRFSMNQGMMKS